jgi:hypothetical protein
MRRDPRGGSARGASLDSPRMPRLAVLLLSVSLGVGAAVLVSCGGDDGPETGIPETNADQMLAELDRARTAIENGDCDEVAESAEQIQEAVNGALVDQGVDEDVRDGIDQGAAHLAELASTSPDCESQEPTTTTEETTPAETEPTTTATPTTTTTTTDTTTATPEPEKPGGGGGGQPSEPPGQPPEPPSGGGTGAPDTGGTGDGQ